MSGSSKPRWVPRWRSTTALFRKSSGMETKRSGSSSTDTERETSEEEVVPTTRKRPSFREFLRDRRSRSKDTAPAKTTAALNPRSATQVHWKVHKMSPGGVNTSSANSLPPPDPPNNSSTIPPPSQQPPLPPRHVRQSPPPLPPQPKGQPARLPPQTQAAPEPTKRALSLSREGGGRESLNVRNSLPPSDTTPPLDARDPPRKALPISANSAFRPIHPAKAIEAVPLLYTDDSEPRLLPAPSGTTPQTTEVKGPEEEAIYFRAADVMAHSPTARPIHILPQPQKKLAESPPKMSSPKLLVAGAPALAQPAQPTPKLALTSRVRSEDSAMPPPQYEEQTASLNMNKDPNPKDSSGSPATERASRPRESNLERWKARKKTMEAARRSQSVESDGHQAPGSLHLPRSEAYPIHSEPRGTNARSLLILGNGPKAPLTQPPKPMMKIQTDFTPKNQEQASPTRTWHLSPSKMEGINRRSPQRRSPFRESWESAVASAPPPSSEPENRAPPRRRQQHAHVQPRIQPKVIESTYAEEYLQPKKDVSPSGNSPTRVSFAAQPQFRQQPQSQQPLILTGPQTYSGHHRQPNHHSNQQHLYQQYQHQQPYHQQPLHQQQRQHPRYQQQHNQDPYYGGQKVTNLSIDPYQQVILTSPAAVSRGPPQQFHLQSRNPEKRSDGRKILSEVHQVAALCRPAHNAEAVVANITMDDYDRASLSVRARDRSATGTSRTSSGTSPGAGTGTNSSLFTVTPATSKRIEPLRIPTSGLRLPDTGPQPQTLNKEQPATTSFQLVGSNSGAITSGGQTQAAPAPLQIPVNTSPIASRRENPPPTGSPLSSRQNAGSTVLTVLPGPGSQRSLQSFVPAPYTPPTQQQHLQQQQHHHLMGQYQSQGQPLQQLHQLQQPQQLHQLQQQGQQQPQHQQLQQPQQQQLHQQGQTQQQHHHLQQQGQQQLLQPQKNQQAQVSPGIPQPVMTPAGLRLQPSMSNSHPPPQRSPQAVRLPPVQAAAASLRTPSSDQSPSNRTSMDHQMQKTTLDQPLMQRSLATTQPATMPTSMVQRLPSPGQTMTTTMMTSVVSPASAPMSVPPLSAPVTVATTAAQPATQTIHFVPKSTQHAHLTQTATVTQPEQPKQQPQPQMPQQPQSTQQTQPIMKTTTGQQTHLSATINLSSQPSKPPPGPDTPTTKPMPTTPAGMQKALAMEAAKLRATGDWSRSAGWVPAGGDFVEVKPVGGGGPKPVLSRQTTSSSVDSVEWPQDDMAAHKSLTELMPGLVLPGSLGKGEDLQVKTAVVGLKHVPKPQPAPPVKAKSPSSEEEEEENSDEDAYRLSLKDKKALFEEKIREGRSRRGPRRSTGRYQTQPVTQEEVDEALKFRPNPATSHLAIQPATRVVKTGEPKVQARVRVTLHSEEALAQSQPQPHRSGESGPGASRRGPRASGGPPIATRSRSLVAAEDIRTAMLLEQSPTSLPSPPVEEPPALSIAQRVALLKESGRSPLVATPPKVTPPESEGTGGSIRDRVSVLRDSQLSWQSRVPTTEEAAELSVRGRLAKAGLPLPLPETTPHRPPRKGNFAPPPLPKPSRPRSAEVVNLDAGLDAFFPVATEPSPAPLAADIDAVGAPTQRLYIPKKGVRAPRKNPSSNRNPLKSKPDPYPLHSAPAGAPRYATPAKKADPTLTPGNRSSTLSAAAVAGLASKEDWSRPSGLLRRADPARTPGSLGSDHPPWTELPMMMLVKGRRPRLSLVEPSLGGLNSGDAGVLVTKERVFVFLGRFANVMERAKASEVGKWVAAEGELGFSGSCLTPSLVNEDSAPSSHPFFASLPSSISPHDSIADDECWDELGWQSIRVWRVEASPEPDLVSVPSEYLQPLSVRLLQSHLVLILDFCSELYVWAGREASPELRKLGLRFGHGIWEEPFPSLEPPALHPLTFKNLDVASGPISRPDWGFFGVVKEQLESVLFRGKFVDWPESVPLTVRQPGEPTRETPKWSPTHSPPSKKAILALKDPSTIERSPAELGAFLAQPRPMEASLVLEGEELGRGRVVLHSEDPALRRLAVCTEEVAVWELPGAGKDPIPVEEECRAVFETHRCSIVRWKYRLSVSDRRTLKGETSKAQAETGRTRTAFFYWQGPEASRADQGFCALALKELDKEQSPRVRVVAGLEPPAFLGLFGGRMLVLDRRQESKPWRLFALLGGPIPSESCLRECDPTGPALRSQGLYLALQRRTHRLVAWFGRLASEEQREVLREAGKDWWSWLGPSYPRPSPDWSLTGQQSLRIFRFKSTAGTSGFGAEELRPSWTSPTATLPFPFYQEDLYAATQPALLLVSEPGDRLWLWEGWLPAEEGEDPDPAQLHKLTLLRLFALRTSLAFAEGTGSPVSSANLVYAGLEPSAFTALFPSWKIEEEAVEANRREGREDGTQLPLQGLLDQLSQTTYPLSRLRQRPLPPGVDGSRLESYLPEDEFRQLFGCDKDTFAALPAWKQTRKRREAELF